MPIVLLVGCQSCLHKFSKRAEACPKCGWKPQAICQICQQKIPFDSTVCPKCGDPAPFELQEKTTLGTFSTKHKNNTSGSTFTSKPSEQKRESVVTNSNTNSKKFSLSWLLFSFDGRIGRKSFWFLYPVTFLLGIILSGALELVKESAFELAKESSNINMSGFFIVVILAIPLGWAGLAIQVKRWHDRNKSGGWVLINFIPIIGPLWTIIELGFLKGTDGNNGYGTDPLSIN